MNRGDTPPSGYPVVQPTEPTESREFFRQPDPAPAPPPPPPQYGYAPPPGYQYRPPPQQGHYYAPQPYAPQRDDSGLVTAGFVAAILLPIVGIIIGIVLLGRGRGSQGAGVIITSIVAMIVFSAILASTGYYE